MDKNSHENLERLFAIVNSLANGIEALQNFAKESSTFTDNQIEIILSNGGFGEEGKGEIKKMLEGDRQETIKLLNNTFISGDKFREMQEEMLTINNSDDAVVIVIGVYEKIIAGLLASLHSSKNNVDKLIWIIGGDDEDDTEKLIRENK